MKIKTIILLLIILVPITLTHAKNVTHVIEGEHQGCEFKCTATDFVHEPGGYWDPSTYKWSFFIEMDVKNVTMKVTNTTFTVRIGNVYGEVKGSETAKGWQCITVINEGGSTSPCGFSCVYEVNNTTCDTGWFLWEREDKLTNSSYWWPIFFISTVIAALTVIICLEKFKKEK